MMLQSVLQSVLQVKKSILLTSYSVFVLRGQQNCNRFVIFFLQAVNPAKEKPKRLKQTPKATPMQTKKTDLSGASLFSDPKKRRKEEEKTENRIGDP